MEGLDLDKIAAGVNPSGLNPETEKKAEEYAKRDWQMSMGPVLEKVFSGGDALSDETIAELQEALFQHKYDVLEKSANKVEDAKAKKRRW